MTLPIKAPSTAPDIRLVDDNTYFGIAANTTQQSLQMDLV